jgi:hypothetical protein
MNYKKHILFLPFLLMNCLMLLAQNNDTSKQLKKSKKMMKNASVFYNEKDYSNAWNLYKSAFQIDSQNDLAVLNAAICASKLNYATDSTQFLESNLKTSLLSDARFYLAKIYHKKHKFNEAITLCDNYSKINLKKRMHTDAEINYLKDMCNVAIQNISNPHRAVIKNMGETINSSADDYVPVIMPDESAIYFTSKRKGLSTKKNGDNAYFEDVYVSQHVNGEWKKAENVGFPINTETNDACVALSPDGLKMIIYRTSTDELSGDLYVTKIGKHGNWEALKLMNNEINSMYIETSACFSKDTTEIYFSSNRPGGFGGKDLYRIKKLPNGKWGVPFNLGEQINTAYDEDAPFLHPDGITLYFSSKGHATMGEYDVFKSSLTKETSQFSKAENLGYPINDVGNDIFFVLSVDGQRGYYSSSKKETFGGVDLYQIDTRFGDNDLAVRRGTAYLNNAPSNVKITLVDKETSEEIGHYSSNPITGKFILVVNPLKNYHAIVEAEGFKTFETDILALTPEKPNEVLQFNLKK